MPHVSFTELRQRNQLIENTLDTPLQGLGKPEALKGQLAGFWLRRITAEHRLLCAMEGSGDARCVIIAQCRYHC